jgi:ComF family protein
MAASILSAGLCGVGFWIVQPVPGDDCTVFLCALCELPSGLARLCHRCATLLPRNSPSCHRCARPLDIGLSTLCGQCQKRRPRFTRAIAPFRYAFPVDRAIHQLKFRRQLIFAAAFAELLAPLVSAALADRDALVPVPLHFLRRWYRGFNQASEIGRYLARITGIPLHDVAKRCRSTRPQTGLTATARRSNVAGAFRVEPLTVCRYPVVIDDVITTGATVDQLAAALLAAGARDVTVIAVARAG